MRCPTPCSGCGEFVELSELRWVSDTRGYCVECASDPRSVFAMPASDRAKLLERAADEVAEDYAPGGALDGI